MTIVTRFAPSPTGFLHLGHAYSALVGFEQARRHGGRFLLRVEDIDPERCRPEFETAFYTDLAWLGLVWEQPVRRQSDHLQVYEAVLTGLRQRELIYPCFCSRRQIADAHAAHPPVIESIDGPRYPGTCRRLSCAEANSRMNEGQAFAWRLDVVKAASGTGPLSWHDRNVGSVPVQHDRIGDVILGRRDVPASYHLSVVVDDALQGVTLVTRGMDLFGATAVHRLLQALLGYPTPDYLHHPLVLDPVTGAKLSKRDGSLSLRAMRDSGSAPGEIHSQLPPL